MLNYQTRTIGPPRCQTITRHLLWRVATLVLTLGSTGLELCTAQEKADEVASIQTQLFGEGLSFPGQEQIALTAPSLRSDMTAAEKLVILEKLSGRHGWKNFSRDSQRAPISVRIQSLKDKEGKKLGYSVRSTYILYASWDDLRSKDLMASTFGDSKRKQVTEALSDEQVAEMELPASESIGYARMDLPLLNQVQLNGVVELEKQESPESVLLCWRLHPDFQVSTVPETPETNSDTGLNPDSGEKPRNQWAKLRQNAQGDLIVGKPNPYQGLGGFVSIVATGQAENQLLFESQLLIHEPEKWFEGRPNYLRAKIPPSMEESARKFRSQLKPKN